jgi:hypothetical protein
VSSRSFHDGPGSLWGESNGEHDANDWNGRPDRGFGNSGPDAGERVFDGAAFKGNDTGGIIAYSLYKDGADIKAMAVNHCASYGKSVKLTGVDAQYGGYISSPASGSIRAMPTAAARRLLTPARNARDANAFIACDGADGLRRLVSLPALAGPVEMPNRKPGSWRSRSTQARRCPR